MNGPAIRRGAWLIACWFLAATGAFANSNYVVIISIDGLRPEFCVPGEMSAVCETLTGLREAGSYAKGAMPPYPSMTYPGHSTIVTGVNPARHGVIANSTWELPATEGRGFWFARDLEAPAIWDAAHEAGLTVGAVMWPVTVESKNIDWNLPELWTTPLGRELDMIRRYATSGLLSNIEARTGAMAHDEAAKWDEFITQAAAYILREHKPNLMFVHLLESDKTQHAGGRGAAELPAVMRRIDGDVFELIEATKKAGTFERTTFIVLGDHGFADIQKALAPNVILVKEGFLTLAGERVTDWKAVVRNTGGSAAVFLRDPKDTTTAVKVRTALEKGGRDKAGKPLYRVVPKDELVKLGGPGEAAFYLEAEPGYMFSGSVTGDEVVRESKLKGNHGFLPTKPDLHTGFIASGRGIKKGVALDVIRLADVAPTVAVLLGIKMGNTDGRVLREILEAP